MGWRFFSERKIKKTEVEGMIVALTWGVWKKRCEMIHDSDNNKRGNSRITLSKVCWAIVMVDEYECLRYNTDIIGKGNPLIFFSSKDQDGLVVFTYASTCTGMVVVHL